MNDSAVLPVIFPYNQGNGIFMAWKNRLSPAGSLVKSIVRI